MTRFIWKFASPKERGEFVRSSHENLGPAPLCELFALTEKGVAAILDGADWASEFSLDGQEAIQAMKERRAALSVCEAYPKGDGE